MADEKHGGLEAILFEKAFVRDGAEFFPSNETAAGAIIGAMLRCGYETRVALPRARSSYVGGTDDAAGGRVRGAGAPQLPFGR